MDFHNDSLSRYESRQRYEDSLPKPQTKLVNYYEAKNPITGDQEWDGWVDHDDIKKKRAILKQAASQGFVYELDTTPYEIPCEAKN
tara:strand:+ start:614 stop:871 length:258 start_codon:yes stop_codon:yes gene_type:complete